MQNLIDFDKSVVGNLDIFDTMQAQLDAGENVVLLANHQTEADPAVRDMCLWCLDDAAPATILSQYATDRDVDHSDRATTLADRQRDRHRSEKNRQSPP